MFVLRLNNKFYCMSDNFLHPTGWQPIERCQGIVKYHSRKRAEWHAERLREFGGTYGKIQVVSLTEDQEKELVFQTLKGPA